MGPRVRGDDRRENAVIASEKREAFAFWLFKI